MSYYWTLLIFFTSFFTTPACAEIKIGLIGDSICLNTDIKKGQGFNELVIRQLAQSGYAIKFMNESMGSSTTQSGRARLERMINKECPDILIIALGINDAGQRFPQNLVKVHLEEMIRLALKHKIKVILGKIDLKKTRIASNDRPYQLSFKQIYKKLQANYSITLFPFLFHEVLERGQGGKSKDGIHPGARGHQLIAKNLSKAILSLIKQFPLEKQIELSEKFNSCKVMTKKMDKLK